MPEEGLRQLARQIVGKKVYFAQEDRQIKASFGGVLRLSDMSKWNFEKIGAVFEYMHNQKGTIAGYPTFTSCKFVHLDDIPALAEYVEELT